MEIESYFYLYLGIGFVVNILITIAAGGDIWRTQGKEFSDPEFSPAMFAIFMFLWPIMVLFMLPAMISDLKDQREQEKRQTDYLDKIKKDSDKLYEYLKANHQEIFLKIETGEKIRKKDIEDIIAICDFYDTLSEDCEKVNGEYLSKILRKSILIVNENFAESTARKFEKRLMENLKIFNS